MHILIVTDAWYPQVNGVVTTLSRMRDELTAKKHDVSLITPEGRRTVAMPGYPEIKLALVSSRAISKEIDDLKPDRIHIATEGPLGWRARSYCLKHGLRFTTSFHTRFPEYFSERLPLPGLQTFMYGLLNRFHSPAQVTLAPTPTVTRRLESLGFTGVKTWARGVDCTRFRPMSSTFFSDIPRPITLCAGRVAPEKNLEAFLSLDLPGTKVIVGDGPQLSSLQKSYPDAVFTGYLAQDQLTSALSAADVFVFPSRSDTYGLVMLEALACGLPVAAYPIESPIDVITCEKVGALHEDLGTAIERAQVCKSSDCIAFAKKRTWGHVAEILENSLVPARAA